MEIEQTIEAKPGADACEQTSAAELIEILRQQGYTALVSLLEEGQPLTPRQIARRLRISTAAAQAMLDKARALLISHGVEMPPMSDLPEASTPAKPARKGKPKTKLAKKKTKPARAAPLVKVKAADIRAMARGIDPPRPQQRLRGSCSSSHMRTMAILGELLMLEAERDAQGAADILSRYSLPAYSTTPDATETRSRAASI